ncbi:MAG: hypothetical protein ABIK37_04930, partial [candidate division WOR-3 bacterium]
MKSGFGFRIDVDRATSDAVLKLVEFALSRGMRFTWFLSTGIGANLVHVVNNLRGQDIQLHGHLHRVFPDVASNLANFRRNREILSQMGIVVQAAAAPYGEWSPQLERAFSEMNLNYSSEFGFAYDDLPGFLPDCQNGEPMLQIPVHPICVGRLRWSRATPRQMLGYFMYVIDTQSARMEPCFLYDHPDDICRVPFVAREVLDYGLSRCGGELNMTDYAGWWRRRSRLKFAAFADSAATTIGIEAGEASDMTVTVEWADHVAALSLKTGRFLHERLRRVPRPESPQPPHGCVQSGIVSTMLFRLRSRRRRLQKHFQTRRL